MGHHLKTFTDNPMVEPSLADKALKIGLGVGVVGLVASAAMGLTSGDEGRHQFFFSWLVAFAFFTTISLGGLFFSVLHHLVRASWSTTLRRLSENLASNLFLMLVLFIPVVVGMHDLYHWSLTDVVAGDDIIQGKIGYLNTTAFLVRAVIYFSIWLGIAWFYRSNSIKQDSSSSPKDVNFKLRKTAPVSILVFALSMTFAAFDWLMSLDAHWFSTMFGIYIFAGSVVAFFATMILIVMWLTSRGQLSKTFTIGNVHDMGKLMFGFIVFWAYVTFSQYFLIWYANIPEETAWFAHRMNHGWEHVGRVVIIGHFIFPFFLLLSRHVKRNRPLLTFGAVWMLLMHFVDLYYLVMPTLHHSPHFHVLDLSTMLGMGGLFVAGMAWQLKRAAAVPHQDPQLLASMRYDNA